MDWMLNNSSTGFSPGSAGTQVTTNGANGKTDSWVELVAASPSVGCIGFILGASGATTGTMMNVLIDIAFGAAGSERVVLSNFYVNFLSTSCVTFGGLFFPIYVPPSTRVSAKLQCSSTGKSVWVTLGFVKGNGLLSNNVYQGIDTLGAVTADSGGTEIDPGASASTYGNWYELEDSSVIKYRGIALNIGSARYSSPAAMSYWVDVGVGAAGGEIAIIDGWSGYFPGGASGGHILNSRFCPFMPIEIPLGSRISVRAKVNITDAIDRLIDAVLYGFY